MSGVRIAGDTEGEHNVLGKGGGYVVTGSDSLHDARWKVRQSDLLQFKRKGIQKFKRN